MTKSEGPTSRVLLAAITCSYLHNTSGFSFTGVSRTSSLHKSSAVPTFYPTLRPPSQLSMQPNELDLKATELFHRADVDGSGHLSLSELEDLLLSLDLRATREEVRALFRALDADGDGEVTSEEFLNWYRSSFEGVVDEVGIVRDVILHRRSVSEFDRHNEVDDVYLRRAVEAGTAAPCRNMREPWRFVSLGYESVEKVGRLMNDEKTSTMFETGPPNWCVVTSLVSPNDPAKEEEDYAATCFALQNFILSMWADGIGTRWRTDDIFHTKEFGDICGVDLETQRVVGVVWYGFAKGGLEDKEQKPERRKGVDEVLTFVP